MSEDRRIVTAQLGREPRGTWRVAVRCGHGRPTVIATEPRLPDGTPFPTLYWLTCPHLVDAVGEMESAGETSAWTQRVADDPRLRFELLAVDQQYRAARSIEGQGDDPCSHLGIAGQVDPAKTKCLHAHVATVLAGIPDPIGREALDAIDNECEQDSCQDLVSRHEGDAVVEGAPGE